MRKLVFFLSAVVFIISFSSCQKQEITGKDAAKELFDSLKVIYENGLANKGDMPIDKVVKCRENLEKKYAEQLKNEKFKKEFEEQNEVYKKEIEKIVQKYPIKQTIINVPPDTTKK